MCFLVVDARADGSEPDDDLGVRRRCRCRGGFAGLRCVMRFADSSESASRSRATGEICWRGVARPIAGSAASHRRVLVLTESADWPVSRHLCAVIRIAILFAQATWLRAAGGVRHSLRVS